MGSVGILGPLSRDRRGEAGLGDCPRQSCTLSVTEGPDSNISIIPEPVAHVGWTPFSLEIEEPAQRQGQRGELDDGNCSDMVLRQAVSEETRQFLHVRNHVRVRKSIVIIMHVGSSIDQQTISTGQLQAIDFHADGKQPGNQRNTIEEPYLIHNSHA